MGVLANQVAPIGTTRQVQGCDSNCAKSVSLNKKNPQPPHAEDIYTLRTIELLISCPVPLRPVFQHYYRTYSSFRVANMAPAGRGLVIVFLLGCAFLGGWGTFGAGAQSGFFESIEKSVGKGAETAYYPGSPRPCPTKYTGIHLLDQRIAFLVTFFTFLIDGPQTWDITLSYCYLAAHFCGGMLLIQLEGFRKGNRGRVASW
jgi:hypothetical protein